MSLFSKIFRSGEKSRKKQCFTLEDHMIKFTGGASYPQIELDSVESIDYQPQQEQWQEVKFKIKDEGVMNYHFDCDPETMQVAVDEVLKGLKPSQPICQFILSAKQGSLSGKD